MEVPAWGAGRGCPKHCRCSPASLASPHQIPVTPQSGQSNLSPHVLCQGKSPLVEHHWFKQNLAPHNIVVNVLRTQPRMIIIHILKPRKSDQFSKVETINPRQLWDNRCFKPATKTLEHRCNYAQWGEAEHSRNKGRNSRLSREVETIKKNQIKTSELKNKMSGIKQKVTRTLQEYNANNKKDQGTWSSTLIIASEEQIEKKNEGEKKDRNLWYRNVWDNINLLTKKTRRKFHWQIPPNT